MNYLIAYFVALVVFGAIDAGWLSTMGNLVYRPLLGDLLATSVRIGPAIAFYLMFPAGVVLFAVLPGLRGGSLTSVLIHGALLGAFAYATYDLTNQATLRVWPLQITLMDIAYGAVASALAAAAAYGVVRWMGGTAA